MKHQLLGVAVLAAIVPLLGIADPSNAELIAAWKSLLMTAKMPEDLPLTPIVSSSSPR